MDKIARTRRQVKRQTAANWPAWTDQVRFTIADGDDSIPSEVWDERAALSAEQDRLDRGVRFF